MPAIITPALAPADIRLVRELFAEYAGTLEVDLAYQGFAEELAGLPGAYAPPDGRLLLATIEGAAAGCVACRRHDQEVCEMKRLYVRPAYRGTGLGRELACRLIAEARASGYATMWLDTLPTMAGALRLYESLGFVRRAPYFVSPVPGNVFMELSLRTPRTSG